MTTPVKLSYPVDSLASYHFYRADEAMARVTEGGYLRLIGDSGAFSAHTQGAVITLAEYAAWCRRWADHLMWRASLDVIGDPVASLANWRALRDIHGVDTIPTVHFGTDPSWIGAYASQGVDFIGLGGLVGKDKSMKAIMRWSAAMFRYARDHYPQVRFHAWGQAGRAYLNALPVYSADSSRSVVAARYGLLLLFDPATGRGHRIPDMNVSPRYGKLLRGVYGVDPAEIRSSHPGNRVLLVRLAAAVNQQYAGWLQRRHQVTAPTYAVRGAPPVGPLIHNVHASADNLDALQPDTEEITR